MIVFRANATRLARRRKGPKEGGALSARGQSCIIINIIIIVIIIIIIIIIIISSSSSSSSILCSICIINIIRKCINIISMREEAEASLRGRKLTTREHKAWSRQYGMIFYVRL